MKWSLIAVGSLAWAALFAEVQARPFLVVAYNVENLFDVDGLAGFEDYAPTTYTRAHALTKLQNIARVVGQFEQGRGPDILIFSEIEADLSPGMAPPDYGAILARYRGISIAEMLGDRFDREIGDLPAEALLAKALEDRGLAGYTVVAGEDVAAPGTTRRLEQKNVVFTRFPVKSARSHPTLDARAILEVVVEVDGAPLYIFANHWKSGASDPATEPTRVANAWTLRRRLDEIFRADPNADVVLGGDFNSQYNQKRRYPQLGITGMNDVLGSQGNELAIRGAGPDLYNLWYELPPAERGSDTFRGEWGTLIHLLVSRGLYDFRGVQYVDNSFGVAKFPGLNADARGLPVRWSAAGPAGSGFSDHFPVFARFITVADGRADRTLALQRASVEQVELEGPVKIEMDLPALALRLGDLPPGAAIRSDAYKGRIFLVEGRVAPGERLAIEFAGEIYDIWSFDEPLRKKLREQYPAGAQLRFYGELGQYRGRWQFVIQDPGWVL